MPVVEARLGYDQALRAAERFRSLFPIDSYANWVFCGGIRREAPTMGEVTHLVHPLSDTAPMFDDAARELGENRPRNLVWLRLDQLVAGQVAHKFYCGSDRGFLWHEHLRGVTYQGIVHRVICAQGRNWGLAMLAATGPRAF